MLHARPPSPGFFFLFHLAQRLPGTCSTSKSLSVKSPDGDYIPHKSLQFPAALRSSLGGLSLPRIFCSQSLPSCCLSGRWDHHPEAVESSFSSSLAQQLWQREVESLQGKPCVTTHHGEGQSSTTAQAAKAIIYSKCSTCIYHFKTRPFSDT